MNDLLFGLSVTVIGLLVVFSGLILLIFSIKLITLFSNGIGNKQQPAQDAPADIDTEVYEAEEAAPVMDLEPGITPELIIAITAAIAAVWQEDSGFIVRRIRRVNNAAAWNLAGREEQVYSRL
jgi:Na+-transporting methylmalonyl-CoA/oxaloacetate decarboxylase gamma subunit